MLGSKTLARAVFFGLGYVVGTRAGRERWAQIDAAARAFAAPPRERVDAGDGVPGSRPTPPPDDPGPDAGSRPGGSRAGAVRTEVHLLGRLPRIPLLRVEGVVDIADLPGSDGGSTRRVVEGSPRVPHGRGRPHVHRPAPTVGRDLAAAE